MGSRRAPDPEELVLRVLRARGECNFNVIRKDTGLSYYTLTRVIDRLVSKGIVVEKRVGRLRVIRLVANR